VKNLRWLRAISNRRRRAALATPAIFAAGVFAAGLFAAAGRAQAAEEAAHGVVLPRNPAQTDLARTLQTFSLVAAVGVSHRATFGVVEFAGSETDHVKVRFCATPLRCTETCVVWPAP
jgi:hypothetical protein